MRTTIFGFCILIASTGWAQLGEPAPCTRPGDCVSKEVCTDTLMRELEMEFKWAAPTCNFENDLKEFNIVRRKVVLPLAVEMAKDFIENDLWHLSALQQTLIDIYYLWPNNITPFRKCTHQLNRELEMDWLQSHDTCYVIYRNYNDKMREELVKCISKRKASGEKTTPAANECIRSLLGASPDPED